MGAPAATDKAIIRALAAAQACGLKVSGYTVNKDGSIEVRTADPAPVDSQPANVSRLTPKSWASR